MVRFVNFFTIFSLVLTGFLISPAVGADKGDLTGVSFVDFEDVAVIADNWLEDCRPMPWTSACPRYWPPKQAILALTVWIKLFTGLMSAICNGIRRPTTGITRTTPKAGRMVFGRDVCGICMS